MVHALELLEIKFAVFRYFKLSKANSTFVLISLPCIASTKSLISSCVIKPFLSRSKTKKQNLRTSGISKKQ